MKEYRVIGPPGTGKTSWLTTQVAHAAEKYGANKIIVCSLTRAAAAVVAGRNETIPPDNIGTLHSMAYRAVGAADIAETKSDGFNEYCTLQRQPMMKLSSAA